MIERRQTSQRQWVLQTIRAHGHLSAQDVYNLIKVAHPDISIATVYRNLNILVETGQVQIVGHSSQKEIYDARTDSHAHFFCRQCGLIEDIAADPDVQAVALLEAAGYHVTDSRLSLMGICAACAAGKQVFS